MKRLLGLAAVAAVLAPAALALPTAMHPELSAKLLGKNEVPKGSPTAHGTANLTLNATKRTVCWTFQLVGVVNPAQAHIHKGRAGTSGPVFIPLGKTYKAKGCATATKKMIEAVEANPNGFYVNVHNVKYPNGVVRGQLVVGMAHM